MLGKISDARHHLQFYLNWSRMGPGPRDVLKSALGDFNVQPGLKTTDLKRKRQTPRCAQMENTQFKNNSYPGPFPGQENLHGLQKPSERRVEFQCHVSLRRRRRPFNQSQPRFPQPPGKELLQVPLFYFSSPIFQLSTSPALSILT